VVVAVALLAGVESAVAIRLGLSMTALQVSIGALNDLVDAPRDVGRMPPKPIPAGLVTPAAARAVVLGGVGTLLIVGLWAWLVPSWFATMAHRTLTPDQPLGLILLVPGAAIMLRCVFDFAWSGHGTPAPFDPPRALVVTGLYRYVRNPMYVGMGLLLLGEALLFPAIRVPMFATC